MDPCYNCGTYKIPMINHHKKDEESHKILKGLRVFA